MAAPAVAAPTSVLLAVLLLILIGQALGGLTLGALCLKAGPGDVSQLGDAGGTVASIVFIGGLYVAVSAALVAATLLLVLRRSGLALFLIVGLEVVEAVVGYLVLPIVGDAVAVSALIAVALLMVAPGVRHYVRS